MNNTFYMQICVQILTVRLCLSALLEHGRVDIYIQPVDKEQNLLSKEFFIFTEKVLNV